MLNTPTDTTHCPRSVAPCMAVLRCQLSLTMSTWLAGAMPFCSGSRWRCWGCSVECALSPSDSSLQAGKGVKGDFLTVSVDEGVETLQLVIWPAGSFPSAAVDLRWGPWARGSRRQKTSGGETGAWLRLSPGDVLPRSGEMAAHEGPTCGTDPETESWVGKAGRVGEFVNDWHPRLGKRACRLFPRVATLRSSRGVHTEAASSVWEVSSVLAMVHRVQADPLPVCQRYASLSVLQHRRNLDQTRQRVALGLRLCVPM